MYTFKLNDTDPICIKYNSIPTRLKQRKLPIESPKMALERDRFPYYLVVEDEFKGYIYYLYIDKDGELGRINIKRKEDHIELLNVVIND